MGDFGMSVFHRLLHFIPHQLHYLLLTYSGQDHAYFSCLFSVRAAGYWLLRSLKSPDLRHSDKSLFNKAQYLKQVVKIILPPLLHKLHNDGDLCLVSLPLY